MLTLLPKASIVATGIVTLLALRNSVRGAKSTKAELDEHHEHSRIVDTLAAMETLGDAWPPRVGTAVKSAGKSLRTRTTRRPTSAATSARNTARATDILGNNRKE